MKLLDFLPFFFFLGSAAAALASFFWFRYQYRVLTKAICDDLDLVIAGRYTGENLDLETQSAKIRTKLQAIMAMTSYTSQQSTKQLQEIQQLISDISHQLKTPLANVILYSDTLEVNEALGKDGIYFLQVMREQIHKLEFLIQSLIKMSRLESHMLVMRSETTLLFPILSKAVSSILPAADQKGLTLEVHCPETLSLCFDPKWTEEAIFNVLDNAVKYTSTGKITVIVESWLLYTRIQVMDTGIGIAPEHQTDVFKRFYREKKSSTTEGVGIGLYLAREILERQGGYITVHSALGQGSCFSLFLSNQIPYRQTDRS